MSKAGDQLPAIPLVEADASGLAEPAQIGAIALNVGTVAGVIVTVKLAVVAHCPAFGVNV